MKLKVLPIIISTFLISISPVFSEERPGFQFKRKPEIENIKPKKPVRVKLERHADGKYTWEITGDDIDEIIKTDKRLRKEFERP